MNRKDESYVSGKEKKGQKQEETKWWQFRLPIVELGLGLKQNPPDAAPILQVVFK